MVVDLQLILVVWRLSVKLIALVLTEQEEIIALISTTNHTLPSLANIGEVRQGWVSVGPNTKFGEVLHVTRINRQQSYYNL